MFSTLEGFKSVGANVRIFNGAKVVGREFITLGDNVIVDDFSFIYASAPLYIGSYVHISSCVSIVGGGLTIIDDFSSVSPGARILSGTDDFSGEGMTNSTIPEKFRAVNRSFVRIGKFAMIGANVVVLPGLSVGEGAVVGAGGVVTGSLDPWGVYVGSPARRVRERKSSIILSQAEALADAGSYSVSQFPDIS